MRIAAPRDRRIWTMLQAGWASLRVRLLGLVLLSLLPGLGLFLVNASEQRRQSESDAQEDALRLARLAAADQDFLVQGVHHLLMTLAQLPAIRNQDSAACRLLLTQLQAQYPLYGGLGAVDREGNIFCSSLPQSARVNVADRDYFREAMATRTVVVGEYNTSRANARTVIPFSYPVLDDTGEPQGVVYAGLDLQWLNEFISNASLPLGATLRIVDRNGATIAHYPDTPKRVGQVMPEKDLLRTMLTQQEGVAEVVSDDSVARLYAFARIRTGPRSLVYVTIGIPKEVAFATANANLARDLIALVVGAVLALAAAWLGSNWFVLRQVHSLLGATMRLSAGDLTARSGKPRGSSELLQLANAFDEMAESLGRQKAAWEHAQEQILQQSRRAEALARIAHRLNSHLNLETVVQAVCEETTRALHVNQVSVALYDSQRKAWYHAGGLGRPEEDAARTQPVPPAWMAPRTASNQNVIVFEPASAEADRPMGARGPRNAHTAARVSLLHEELLVGSLSLFFTEPREFTGDELALLRGIADEAALAITHAQLYNALKREERAHAMLLHKVITAQEDERKRIARDLHDQIGQSLNLLKMRLELGRANQGVGSEGTDPHLASALAIAGKMLDNLHSLITDLRPSLLDDLGLVPAIAWYGRQWLKPLGIDLQISGNGERRLPPITETALFRIAQEALANIVRHAGATHVRVTLRIEDHATYLTVQDNGRGFKVPVIGEIGADGGGLGLLGMQERAALLGGEFHVHTAPGFGTTITVRVSLGQEAAFVQDSCIVGG